MRRSLRLLQSIIASWLLLAAGAAVSQSAAKQTSDWRWQSVPRVVAIGDVHGAYDAFTGILRAAGVVDGQLSWSGGTTHLVNLGDLIDRGPGSRKVLDLLMRLEGEAASTLR